MNNNTKKDPTFDKRCGTNSGYIAHSRRGESYCQACKEAHSKSVQDFDKRNPDKAKARKKRYSKTNPEAITRSARTYYTRLRSYSIEDILEKYGTNCHICSDPIDLSASRKVGNTGWEMSLHFDHLIPLSKNGKHSVDNLRPAHAICNLKKSNNA